MLATPQVIEGFSMTSAVLAGCPDARSIRASYGAVPIERASGQPFPCRGFPRARRIGRRHYTPASGQMHSESRIRFRWPSLVNAIDRRPVGREQVRSVAIPLRDIIGDRKLGHRADRVVKGHHQVGVRRSCPAQVDHVVFSLRGCERLLLHDIMGDHRLSVPTTHAAASQNGTNHE